MPVGDSEGPGFEIAAMFEVRALAADHEIAFLQDILGGDAVGDEC